MIERLDETIVAVSSAQGRAAAGIVRLSGPDAIRIADAMITTHGGQRLADLPAWTQHEAEVSIDQALTLPARVLLFRQPRSYTRQHLVEVHTVGSPFVLEMVQQRALNLGARAAMPGEFTARAFLRGGMNLAAAEAVAGVIRARTDTQLRASRRQLDGLLSRRVAEARDELAELLALVEADIDFAEEPIEFITPATLRERLTGVFARLRELEADSISTERLDWLPRVLLLGPPNAGKSSLMNRLSGADRAICAPLAGTTRDILSAALHLGSSECILLDSAGIDESEDEVLERARAMTLSTAERVDAICLVIDGSRELDADFVERVRGLALPSTIVALNKADLVSPDVLSQRQESWQRQCLGPVVAVSALDGRGLDDLRQALGRLLNTCAGSVAAEAVMLNERQRSAVRAAGEALERASALTEEIAETIDCADLAAFELREALDRLGEITGEVTTEDLLSQVFSRFCIGK